MGVSTSASLLIIFFGTFIALGAVYTATSNTTDELTDAYGEELSAQTEIEETALSVEAIYHETDENLTVRADNDGSTELAVSATDVLIDGEFNAATAFDIVTVDDRETEFWKAGESLRLEKNTAMPERVKVVTETGVAATTAVEAAGIENVDQDVLNRTSSDTYSTIEFDIDSTYEDDVTLLKVSVDDVDNDAERINYADDDDLSEVNITLSPDHGEAGIAEGNFSVGQTIPHVNVSLDPDRTARYRIGEFRNGDGEPVNMVETVVTITITFEDPAGVERTFTFTEGDF